MFKFKFQVLSGWIGTVKLLMQLVWLHYNKLSYINCISCLLYLNSIYYGQLQLHICNYCTIEKALSLLLSEKTNKTKLPESLKLWLVGTHLKIKDNS